MIRTTSLALGLLAAAGIGCGRSVVFQCALEVSPTSLDFGSTPFGTPVSKSITVTSVFNDGCSLTGISIGAGSDPGFAVQGGSSLGVQPGTEMQVSVTFTPASATPEARGTLVFETSDPEHPAFSIRLSATVLACDLSVPDGGIDFGTVSIGTPATQPVTLANLGLASCEVSVSLSPSSDPGFSLPSSATSLAIAPGGSATLPLQFEIGADDPPEIRTGQLVVTSNDQQNPSTSVPLMAELPTCILGVSPSTLDFGNISLNASATDQVVLFNDGGLDCNVSGLALAASSDPDFSLPPTQATSFTVAPGAQVPVSVTFSDLSGSNPPYLRTGTLDFETGDAVNPNAEVPLEAYVNIACVAASQWIYTVDSSGKFAQFDPATMTFTYIGELACPAPAGYGPFSMAVDQNAVAWVLYGSPGFTSGELFQVDTTTAACQATSFVPNQGGMSVFGMSFVFQPTTGLDTLYVAGAGTDFNLQTSNDLATISFPSLVLSPIAPVTLDGGELPGGELAGTGDGELWDFIPTGGTDGEAIFAQLDPQTAATIQVLPLPNVTNGGSFATKFWGGSFWIFINSQVYEVPRATGVASLVIEDDGYSVVGAGVSTCAPVQ